MSDMFDTMMHNPWFYVVLMGVLILLTVGPLLAIRILAHKEKGKAGSSDNDPHLT